MDQSDPVGFFCYSRLTDQGATTAINCAVLKNDLLEQQDVIFIANNSSWKDVHFGCRLAIVDDHLYVSLGERGDRHAAQNLQSHSGSVVRINLDGSIAHTIPQQSGWRPEILTKGHRNPQGMAVNPRTGEVWVNEHGPKGGDEINILRAGANYGWPLLTFGKEYAGRPVGEGKSAAPVYLDSIWHWTPSIAPSGMAFYQGDMFPEFSGDLLVSSLKFRSLYRKVLEHENLIRESIIVKNKIGRIRDIEIAPDSNTLILSDEDQGGLYRLSR
jgi:glucose/arabinose dehydrogenase